ncbi:MAG: tRNA dihydrouridine synthase DusB [Bacilli bacterium]
MFEIGNTKIKSPLVLAPLAGYTNSVYRNLCGAMGAGLVYTEMISAKGILYDNEKTLEMIDVSNDKYPVCVQLFGYDIDEMVRAGKIIEHLCHPVAIDINMGCPVKKVVKNRAGSYLLGDEDHAVLLVKRMSESLDTPITVKMRLGIDSANINCVTLAKSFEQAGAKMIAIHGRTKAQMYKGTVNLDYIKQVKEAVNIPVIGNGDVRSYADAKRMLNETGVDAVMIGRGTYGNPWIFQEILCKMQAISYTSKSIREKFSLLKQQLTELIELKGEKKGVLEMRGISMWYVRGMKHNRFFKQQVVLVKTEAELIKLIDEFEESQYE